VTILHASDVHFGRPHLPELSRAVVRFVHRERPGAVVVSGDLTQRARAGEYRAAREFLDELAPCPVIVTPGNHDVPLFRVWERLFAPYRNYRIHIGHDLDTILDVNGGAAGPARVRFVALSSSAPLRAIVNGRVTPRQLAFADEAFAATSAGALRVLVIHHNLIAPRGGPRAPPLRGAGRLLEHLRRWGVHLVLSGHVHRSHLGWSNREGSVDGAAGVPVLLAGTASSDRGRGSEKGRNSFNVIRVGASGSEVAVYLYSRDAGDFLPERGRRYPGSVPVTVP